MCPQAGAQGAPRHCPNCPPVVPSRWKPWGGQQSPRLQARSCANAGREGLSLSQKEQVSFVPNGYGFQHRRDPHCTPAPVQLPSSLYATAGVDTGTGYVHTQAGTREAWSPGRALVEKGAEYPQPHSTVEARGRCGCRLLPTAGSQKDAGTCARGTAWGLTGSRDLSPHQGAELPLPGLGTWTAAPPDRRLRDAAPTWGGGQPPASPVRPLIQAKQTQTGSPHVTVGTHRARNDTNPGPPLPKPRFPAVSKAGPGPGRSGARAPPPAALGGHQPC